MLGRRSSAQVTPAALTLLCRRFLHKGKPILLRLVVKWKAVHVLGFYSVEAPIFLGQRRNVSLNMEWLVLPNTFRMRVTHHWTPRNFRGEIRPYGLRLWAEIRRAPFSGSAMAEPVIVQGRVIATPSDPQPGHYQPGHYQPGPCYGPGTDYHGEQGYGRLAWD